MATLDNLQAAYNGESNANNRYLAFAKKADAEGYTQVASLFRAAAKAEEIHASKHAETIIKMGGVPKADIKASEVKSTKENLVAAIQGETYERDVMYPDFIKVGEAENVKDALRSYKFALAAETEHAKLYQEAHDNLEAWRGGKKDFFVCPVCGFTTTKLESPKCPVCGVPEEKFLKIN